MSHFKPESLEEAKANLAMCRRQLAEHFESCDKCDETKSKFCTGAFSVRSNVYDARVALRNWLKRVECERFSSRTWMRPEQRFGKNAP